MNELPLYLPLYISLSLPMEADASGGHRVQMQWRMLHDFGQLGN